MAKIIVSFVAFALAFPFAAGQTPDAKPIEFPFKENDRVAWVGSSSTKIGVWPKTMQFLLATRHPELKLTFGKFTTGGGTFATGLQKMDEWLSPFKPTVVFFNYGGNDAGAGEKGLPKFQENIADSVAKAKSYGARVYLLTPQAADVRKAGEAPAARRALYADALIRFGKEKGWPVIDVHHPLAELQKLAQNDDDAYTILADTIHLTPPAYIAWAYYQYDRLNPPARESSATLRADGHVTSVKNCKISDVKATEAGLTFTRADEILPILPPQSLPPRSHVPLERLSRYMLQIEGLKEGDYTIASGGKSIGATTAAALAKGVNLNTLLLDAKGHAPWSNLAKDLWEGDNLDQIGQTRWTFDVRRK
jgi:lysophospholipase L1-like esterase